jgi:hypothetical protein
MPTVSHESNTYTFTLWRDGKEVTHAFKDACVILSYGNEKSIPAAQLAKMNGPSYEGWTYHIFVNPRDGDETFIWLSKDEFEALQPMIESIEGPEEEKEDDPYETQEVMRAFMRNVTVKY